MRNARSQGRRGQHPRAGIYVRLSKWEPDDADAVSSARTRQEPDCRKVCANRAFEVVDVYIDEDRSAFSGARRPDYERLLEDVERGRLDVIVAQHPDRLHRHPIELEGFVTLLERTGVDVVTATAGDVDLETPEGKLMARVTGAVARKESEDKSRRGRRLHEGLAQDGKPNGGRRPLGYHHDRLTPATPETFPCRHPYPERCTARPDEAATVVEVIERVASGETLTAIADDLNDRGVATSAGSPWSIWTVRRVTLNARYAGRRMHKGEDVGPAAWPALVPEATWRRARALLRADDRPARRTPRRYLLTGGMIVCGRCGTSMRSKQQHGPTGVIPAYTCAPRRAGGCGAVSIRADHVEELVSREVVRLVGSADYARQVAADRAGDGQGAATVERVEAELVDLMDAKSTGAITMREYLAMRPGIMERLDSAREAMAGETSAGAVARYVGHDGRLAADWPSLTLDVRQSIIRAVLAPVVIAPVGKSGNRFDANRVGVQRRV